MQNDGVNERRRRVLTTMTSVVGAAGAVGVAVPFVGSWNPSAKAKAAGAPVEVNVGKIEPGARITVEWRGKPVFIVRRTEDAVNNLNEISDLLEDPDSKSSVQPEYANNFYRSIKKEFAVLLGVCTHLGCAPEYRPNMGTTGGEGALPGGFLCNCHGSMFDLAGRVKKKSPAPSNLEVPPYKYLSDSVILIGEDQEA